MDSIESYSYLFADSFMGALIIPPHSELVFDVMRHFGHYHPILMLLLAVSGSGLGSIVNWLLGKILLTCERKEWFIKHTGGLERAGELFRQYAVWLLCFSWLPFLGPILTLAAGVLRVRFGLFIVLVILGKMAYYSILLFWHVIEKMVA